MNETTGEISVSVDDVSGRDLDFLRPQIVRLHLCQSYGVLLQTPSSRRISYSPVYILFQPICKLSTFGALASPALVSSPMHKS